MKGTKKPSKRNAIKSNKKIESLTGPHNLKNDGSRKQIISLYELRSHKIARKDSMEDTSWANLSLLSQESFDVIDSPIYSRKQLRRRAMGHGSPRQFNHRFSNTLNKLNVAHNLLKKRQHFLGGVNHVETPNENRNRFLESENHDNINEVNNSEDAHEIIPPSQELSELSHNKSLFKSDNIRVNINDQNLEENTDNGDVSARLHAVNEGKSENSTNKSDETSVGTIIERNHDCLSTSPPSRKIINNFSKFLNGKQSLNNEVDRDSIMEVSSSNMTINNVKVIENNYSDKLDKTHSQIFIESRRSQSPSGSTAEMSVKTKSKILEVEEYNEELEKHDDDMEITRLVSSSERDNTNRECNKDISQSSNNADGSVKVNHSKQDGGSDGPNDFYDDAGYVKNVTPKKRSKVSTPSVALLSSEQNHLKQNNGDSAKIMPMDSKRTSDYENESVSCKATESVDVIEKERSHSSDNLSKISANSLAIQNNQRFLEEKDARSQSETEISPTKHSYNLRSSPLKKSKICESYDKNTDKNCSKSLHFDGHPEKCTESSAVLETSLSQLSNAACSHDLHSGYTSINSGDGPVEPGELDKHSNVNAEENSEIISCNDNLITHAEDLENNDLNHEIIPTKNPESVVDCLDKDQLSSVPARKEEIERDSSDSSDEDSRANTTENKSSETIVKIGNYEINVSNIISEAVKSWKPPSSLLNKAAILEVKLLLNSSKMYAALKNVSASSTAGQARRKKKINPVHLKSIKRRWKEFCRLYDFNNEKSMYFHRTPISKNFFSHNFMKYLLAFISQDIKDVSERSVQRAFENLSYHQSISGFSKYENAVMLAVQKALASQEIGRRTNLNNYIDHICSHALRKHYLTFQSLRYNKKKKRNKTTNRSSTSSCSSHSGCNDDSLTRSRDSESNNNDKIPSTVSKQKFQRGLRSNTLLPATKSEFYKKNNTSPAVSPRKFQGRRRSNSLLPTTDSESDDKDKTPSTVSPIKSQGRHSSNSLPHRTESFNKDKTPTASPRKFQGRRRSNSLLPTTDSESDDKDKTPSTVSPSKSQGWHSSNSLPHRTESLNKDKTPAASPRKFQGRRRSNSLLPTTNSESEDKDKTPSAVSPSKSQGKRSSNSMLPTTESYDQTTVKTTHETEPNASSTFRVIEKSRESGRRVFDLEDNKSTSLRNLEDRLKFLEDKARNWIRLVDCLLEINGNSRTTAYTLKNEKFSVKDWRYVSSKISMPAHAAKAVFEARIHPLLFSDKPINRHKLILNMLCVLETADYETWDDVNWLELSEHFDNLKPLFLFSTFAEFAGTYVPLQLQTNIKDCIGYLLKNKAAIIENKIKDSEVLNICK